jgi:hypothetical protein
MQHDVVDLQYSYCKQQHEDKTTTIRFGIRTACMFGAHQSRLFLLDITSDFSPPFALPPQANPWI